MKGSRDPHVREFLKAVDTACTVTHDRHRVFTEFLEMGYCAVAQRNGGLPNSVANEDLEARYMTAIKPYAEHEARHQFGKMLGMMQMGVSRGEDFLGKVAGEAGMLNEHMGQFFTPVELCRASAKMIISDVGPLVRTQGYVSVMEPACGAGAMLLAAADILEEQGHDLPTSMLVHATDLSDVAFKMCYLQLSARGVAAYVERGNSLTLERFEHAWTPGAAAFYRRHGHLFNAPDRAPVRKRSRAGRVNPGAKRKDSSRQ